MPLQRKMKAADVTKYQKDIAVLKTAFDLVSDHIVITDIDAHVLYANKAAEETTGFTLSEMLGKNPGDLWGGNMPEETWKEAWHTLKKKKQPVVLDVRNTRKDGTEVWQSLHISPVLDERGDVRLFIGIEPNITDQKQKEQFREHFLSILGHKTLGPMTGIQWIVELLCERGNLPKEHRAQLRELYSESKTLTSLLSDLLYISRMGKGHPVNEDIDLARLLADVAEAMSRRSARRFSFAKPEAHFPLHTDPFLARELIRSMCEYMIGRTPPDATITLSLQQEDEAYRLSCSASRMQGREHVEALTPATIVARHLQWALDTGKGESITVRIPRRV